MRFTQFQTLRSRLFPTKKTLERIPQSNPHLPMGLFSWLWRGSSRGSPEQTPAKGAGGAQAQVAVPGRGAREQRRGRGGGGARARGAAPAPQGGGGVRGRRHPPDATVFDFGSAGESGTAVTLAGYCPVSDELEPCRWELVPATGEG